MLWETGCSHTYGDDLEDKEKAWPYLLSDKLNLSCVNNAISGGSNDRIVYETLKSNTSSLVVIAWTYIERFTQYNTANYQINFNPQLKHEMMSNDYTFEQYGKLHYAHWYNDLYAFKLWLQQIILVQSYLIRLNQPYIMINANNNRYNRYSVPHSEFNNSIRDLVCFDLMTDVQLTNEYNEIQKYISMIDLTYFYDITFSITDLDSKFATGKTNHLLEDGHAEIARRIYEFYV